VTQITKLTLLPSVKGKCDPSQVLLTFLVKKLVQSEKNARLGRVTY